MKKNILLSFFTAIVFSIALWEYGSSAVSESVLPINPSILDKPHTLAWPLVTDASQWVWILRGGILPIQPIATLTPSETYPYDNFGTAIAMDQNTLVVGGGQTYLNGIRKEIAYVFTKTDANWANISQSARLLSPEDPPPGASANFGISVAIDGNVIVVGANWADSNGIYVTGAAYVFLKPLQGWSGDIYPSAKLTASDVLSNDGFGRAVAIFGETIAIGSPERVSQASFFDGSVYVFSQPENGWEDCPPINSMPTCIENAKLLSSDVQDDDFFGWAVAMDDNKIVVGAPHLLERNGHAYVYLKPENGWSGLMTENFMLEPSDSYMNDQFGSSVALDKDVIMVGATRLYNEKSGALYVYQWTDGQWVSPVHESAILTPSLDSNIVFTGKAVAIENGIVVAGSAEYPNEKVLVFTMPPGGWHGSVHETAIIGRQENPGDQFECFGGAVAIKNGGFVIGDSCRDNNGIQDAGVVYVYSNDFEVVHFMDVPADYWAWKNIEGIYRNEITGGCQFAPILYCPDRNITRVETAIFLLRSMHGSAYIPPAAQGSVFGDVPAAYWAAGWIEQIFTEGISVGCGNGNFCPGGTLTREQAAILILRAKHGAGYVPPDPSGVFLDVPVDSWAAAWIEQLAAEGITSGCGDGKYCPTMPVTRAQMAVFLTKAFNLP